MPPAGEARHAGEDDDLAFATLKGVCGIEVDFLKDERSVASRETVFQCLQLALIWCDDTDVALVIVIWEVGLQAVEQCHCDVDFSNVDQGVTTRCTLMLTSDIEEPVRR